MIFSTGRKKTFDQQQEADELAVGQLAVDDEIGAGDHHDDLGQPHAEVAERHAGRHDPVGFELGLPIAGVVAREEPALVILVGERLDHANAADVFLDPGVELSDPAEERLARFASSGCRSASAMKPVIGTISAVINASFTLTANIRANAPMKVMTATKISSGP